MKVPIIIVVVTLVGAPLPLGAAQKQPTGVQADLSGAWELNREASSSIPAGLGPDTDGGGHRGDGGSGSGHGGGRGGFGGSGMGAMGGHGAPGGPPADRPDKEEMQRMRDLTHEVLVSPVRLVIDQAEALVTFTDDEGHVRRFAANGKSEKHQLTSGTVNTKTRWEDGAVVMELEIPHGVKLSRRYALSVAAGARQLIVTTDVTGGDRGPGGKRSPIKAVYDPALTEQ